MKWILWKVQQKLELGWNPDSVLKEKSKRATELIESGSNQDRNRNNSWTLGVRACACMRASRNNAGAQLWNRTPVLQIIQSGDLRTPGALRKTRLKKQLSKMNLRLIQKTVGFISLLLSLIWLLAWSKKKKPTCVVLWSNLIHPYCYVCKQILDMHGVEKGGRNHHQASEFKQQSKKKFPLIYSRCPILS